MNMSIDEAFRRLAELPTSGLRSEEDVKIKIVLPMLRALGYDDADFNYEARTGRGYVDIVVERFPVGIVVETKASDTRLNNYLEQLEVYLFHKHCHDRIATLAMLTDGDTFHIYGVTEAFRSGELAKYQIDYFRRSKLSKPDVQARLSALLGRENNERGTIPDVIAAYRQEAHGKRERLQKIDRELLTLSAERKRIDASIIELEAEKVLLVGAVPSLPLPSSLRTPRTGVPEDLARVSSPHILRLLRQRGAHSRQTAVERKWLDEMLIGKEDRVDTKAEVSFGLIELRKKGIADYDKPKTGRVKAVWLIEREPPHPSSVGVKPQPFGNMLQERQ